VEGRALDRAAASRALRSMGDLVDRPDEIAAQKDDLETISRSAASWADAAASASPELTAAVGIRGAADELLAYATYGGDLHLTRARQQLAAARRALAGGVAPRDNVQGVRDRINNLQRSEEEKLRQLDDALKQ